MKTVDELINHMKEYKDAVIIIGPGILEIESSYTTEEFNENYTRKNLVRNPEALWNFFHNKIKREMTEKEKNIYNKIAALSSYASNTIDQNTVGNIFTNRILLHGNSSIYSCMKCKISYTDNYITDHNIECEECGGQVRPSVLLSGERYNDDNFKKIKESIQASHTIFLIGMDYTEAPLMQLIAEYADVNAINEDYTRILVSVQTKEEEFDPNEMCHFNFVVKDDIEDALDRLLGKF